MSSKRRAFSTSSEAAASGRDHCEQCGDCCRRNGLIPLCMPPNMYRNTEPWWLVEIVHSLRLQHASIAEQFPCMMLDDDNTCMLHDSGEKPEVCRDFECWDFNPER